MAKTAAKHAQTSSQVQGSNNAGLIADMLTRAGNLGTAEGQGANSRPELAMEVAKAASEGWLQPNYSNDKSTDVHKVFEAFADARTSAKHDGGKDRGDAQGSSFKVQVSKLNAIAKCGALALKATPVDGFDTLSRAREILRGKIETKMSAYDALVAVARKQVEQGEEALSDADIKDTIGTKARDEESDAEREHRVLDGSIKTLEKLFKGTEDLAQRPSPELESALENLRARRSALEFTIESDKAQAKRDLFLREQEAKRQAQLASAAGLSKAA